MTIKEQLLKEFREEFDPEEYWQGDKLISTELETWLSNSFDTIEKFQTKLEQEAYEQGVADGHFEAAKDLRDYPLPQ